MKCICTKNPHESYCDDHDLCEKIIRDRSLENQLAVMTAERNDRQERLQKIYKVLGCINEESALDGAYRVRRERDIFRGALAEAIVVVADKFGGYVCTVCDMPTDKGHTADCAYFKARQQENGQ